MAVVLRKFDMHAFHATLDAAREARGLSWPALAAEINRPFEGTPSIPVTPGTLRNMLDKTSVTSAVVLQSLAWLQRTPESFLSGIDEDAHRNEALPESGPGRILRFDTRAMFEALNAERDRRGMKWREVARELPGFTESMLTNLAAGPLIGFPRVMLIPQWLRRSAASFVRVCCR